MNTHGIVTPEAVVLDFEPAGVASRILARLVDIAAQLAFLGTFSNFLFIATGGNETGFLIGLLIVTFLALFAYPAVLEAMAHGRTLGKMAIGLRVVTVEGAPVRFRHTSVRSMMQLIDIVLTFGGAAIASSVVSKRGQRLGDILAGTMVIRERRAASVLAEQAVRFPNPRGLDELVLSIDPSPLGPGQAALLRGFLIRVTELDPAARASIAARLSQRVSHHLGQPLPPGLHPETWLACVAAALQRRSEYATAATMPVEPPGPVSRSSLPMPPPPPRQRSADDTSSLSGRGWVPPS